MSNEKMDVKSKFEILGMDAKYYIPALIIFLLGIMLGGVGKGMVFAFPMLLLFSFILAKIGDKIPFFNDWLGGGLVLAMLVGAFAKLWLPEATMETIQIFYKSDNFLIFIIGNLIVGSIMGMNRKILLKASVGFIPTILGSVAVAYLLTGLVGAVTGYGFKEAILFVAQPIIGGGMGAGAIPMAEIYASAGKESMDHYLSILAAAVLVGNVLAILAGAILNKLGEIKPKLTGNGQLVNFSKSNLELDLESENTKTQLNPMKIANILVYVGVFIILGTLANKFIPVNVHAYAWMIILCILAKMFDVFPKDFYASCRTYLPNLLAISIPVIMFGIGIFYIDVNQFVTSISDPVFVLLCVTTIVGSIIGAGLVGMLFNFYFVESAIAAGLCMANMGGSGDVAVLGASKRMDLLPFAQVSSRVGGAIILIICGMMLSLL